MLKKFHQRTQLTPISWWISAVNLTPCCTANLPQIAVKLQHFDISWSCRGIFYDKLHNKSSTNRNSGV